MKSFLEKSKRALVLLLTGAMIATSVPSTAFAATVANEDVIIEEATDAVAEDAVVEEEVVATPASEDTAVEAVGDSADAEAAVLDEEPVEDSEDKIPADDASDKIIQIPAVPNVSFSYGINGTNQSFTATFKPDTTSAAQTLTTATISLLRVDNADSAEYASFGTKMSDLQSAQSAYIADPSDATKLSTLVAARDALEAEPAFVKTVNLPEFISYGGTSHTGENGVFTFKTTARPTQVYSGKYVAKVADSSADNQPMYSNIFTVGVSGADIGFTPAVTANNNVYNNTGANVTANSVKKLDGSYLTAGSYPLITLGSPSSVKMNYNVYDQASEKPSTDTNWVVGEAIDIAADRLYTAEDGNQIKDLNYVFTKADGTVLNDEFTATVYYDNAGTLTAATTAENKWLYNNNPLTVIITPQVGLAEDATHVGGMHEAYLHIYSPTAYTSEWIAKVSFTVASDLELSILAGDDTADAIKVSTMKGILDKDAKKDVKYLQTTTTSGWTDAQKTPGSAENPFVLATSPIGTSFADSKLKVLATGGKGTVSISASGANFIADGIDGTADNQNRSATFSFTGALNQKNYSSTYNVFAADAFTPASPNGATDSGIQAYIAAHEFQITATDGAKPVSAYFIVLPDEVDKKNIGLTIDETKLTTYATTSTNKYSWRAPSETTDVTTSTKTLTVENKSAVDLAFDYAGVVDTTYADYTYKASNTAGTSPLTVKAGESQTITIAPKVKTEGNATTANIAKANLTINGKGIEDTVTEINFQKAGAVFEVTNPIANYTTITGGEVGVAYDGYKFAYTKDEAAIFASWTVGDVKLLTAGTWNEGTSYAPSTDATVKLSDYGLAFNAATGEITGTPTKAGNLIIPVTAAYYANSASSTKLTVPVTVRLNIVIPTVGTAIRVKTTSNDSVVTHTAKAAGDAKVVNMGDINKDAKEGKEVAVEIENLTAADLEGVKVQFNLGNLSKKEGSAAAKTVTGTDYFNIIYSEDTALQNEYTTKGIKIPKNGKVTVKIVSKPGIDVALYTGVISVADGCTAINGVNYFGIKLNVKDTPVLTNTNITSGTGFTVGTEIGSTAVSHYFEAAYTAMPALTYNYSWVGKDGETAAQIADTWGLTLTSDSTTNKGYVRGKPKKAGKLTVEVTATATTNAAVTTTKEVEINIAGNSTIQAKIGTDTVVKNSTTPVTGMTYVLPGFIVGETKTSTLTIVNDGTEKITGLKITVDDAFDDRKGTVKAASDKSDIYNGSKDVITIAAPSETTLEAGTGTATARITAAATSANNYKVKVTISADNLAEQVFYMYVVASEQMTLDAPVNPVATVGVPTYLEVKALNTKENVTWTEVTKADSTGVATTNSKTGATASNLTKAGFATYFGNLNTNAGEFNTAAITSETTNLGSVINTSAALKNKGTATGESAYIRSLIISSSTENKKFAPVTADSGTTVTGIKISDYGKAAPTTAESYDVYLKADVAAGTITDVATAHFKENGTTAESATEWINYNGTGANAPIAKQTAYTTIALTVNKSSAIDITNVTSEVKATAPARTDYDTKTGITANKEGTTIKQVTNYAFKEAAENYNVADGANTIYVGITNSSKTAITANLSYDKNKFTVATADIATPGTGNANGTVTPGSTHVLPTVSLAAETTTYVKVTPATSPKLAKGTYTDTLTLSGDNMTDVTMGLSFTVAERSYVIDAEYMANDTGLKDAADYVSKRDDSKLDKVVDKNVVGTDKKIELSPVILGGSAGTNDTIFVRNTGNSAISKLEVVEVSAIGGSEVGSPSAHLLMYGVNATPSSTSKLSATGVAVTADDAIAGYVTVKPNLANTTGIPAAGEYNAFLRFIITATAGADPVNVDIPVSFTVYDKDMTGLEVTPDATSEINLTSVAEGYAQTDFGTSGDLVVKNTNTGDTSKGFYGVTVTLEDSTHFEVVTSSENTNISYASPDGTIAKIPAGGSETVTVLPKKGLPAGAYTTAVIIKGGNLKNTEVQRRVINATITTNTSFTADVYSTDAISNGYVTAGTIDTAFAKRLFTALGAVSADTTSSNKNFAVTFPATATTTKVVTIDLDKNGVADTNVTFTGGSAFDTGYKATDVSKVTAVTIQRIGSQPLADASYTIPNISINEAQDNTYFKSITFNMYSFVTFMATYETWYVNGVYGEYEKDNTNFTQLGGYGANYTTKNEAKLLTGRAVADTSATGTVDNEVFRIKVANGSSAASILTDNQLPTAVYVDGTKKFENWQVSGGGKVTGVTPVSDDDLYVIYWHEHDYPATTKGNTEFITWTWADDLTQATVTIKCLEGDGDELTFKSTDGNVTIASKEVPADCVKGKRTVYTATCTKIGTAIYTDEKSTAEDTSTILGHTYKTTITWEKQTDNTYKPVIKQVCTRDGCTAETTNHEFTVTNAVTAAPVVVEPTCTEKGKTTYTLTSYVDGNGNTITLAATDTGAVYEVETDAKGHNEAPELTVEDFNEETLKATVTATCPDCGTKLFGPAELTAVKNADETYKFTFVGTDGKEYKIDWSNHEHNWSAPVWTWDPADEGIPTAATATFTCSVGQESKTVNATITDAKDGEQYIDYTAKVTFNGKDYTDVITIDAVTKKRTAKHEHNWGAPTWSWSSKEAATATFICSVGKESKSVVATGTDISVAKGPNSKGNTQYKATVTGPDGKTYEDLKWFDASGNPTSGEGIGIELAETEYPYTGAKIIPVFTVVDYALDKVLAEKTDYTVKYTNNVNVGTATITVTGKGNYGVKNVTITESFTITDPMDGEDTTDYAGSIKSVKASKDGYTYDGTAKYPKTLTIKTKNDGEITATYDADAGEYTLNDGAKNVMIVVTNNINKGSGTVAVTGADKKTKKTTFPIKAADLSTASTEDLTINVDPAIYAVKGAIPAVEVSYKGLDLTEGADYTVKYKNNKAVGTATATITGKGNFAKSAAPVSFEVTPFEITKVDNVAVYAGVAGKGVKVTMYDAQGNVIPAKKNYTVKVEKGDTDITADKTKLQAGEEIKVTVTAAAGGNLEPDSSADIDITVAPNLAKIKVNVPKTFTKTFTGEAIELDEEDFESGKIAVGSLKYGEDFEIIGYQNNVKKGKMTVYIQGISENASGTGKFKVTIAPQTMKKAD